MKNGKLNVDGSEIRIFEYNAKDYISLTDIAKQIDKRTDNVIMLWLRSIETLDFLNEWESKYNTDYDQESFKELRSRAGSRVFQISVKEWIDTSKAIGITARAGRYGGTYAHKHIAFEFCTAVSARFKLYLIDEFERLKSDEAKQLGQQWDLRRELTKMNYLIHTEAVREEIVPLIDQRTKREGIYFASEADMMNMAIFGIRSKEWKSINPKKKGNIRDHATTQELQVLANIETTNATLLKMGLRQDERYVLLAKKAKNELEIIASKKQLE